MSISLSVVIPVYNEQESIIDSVDITYSTLIRSGIDFEMVFINDGSTDRSLELLQQNLRQEKAKIINHLHNRGFGNAIKTGIENAEKTYVLCVPIDSPLESDELELFLKYIDDTDILLSYRDSRKGYNLFMLFNSLVYHFLVSAMFRIDYKDYNWIHLYKREIFFNDKVRIEYDGVFMLAEIIIKGHYQNMKIKEFEIAHKARQKGTPSSVKVKTIYKTLVDMLDFYRKFNSKTSN